MELNHKNYKKTMDKIYVSAEADEKVIKTFEEQLEKNSKSSKQNKKTFRMSGRVLLIAASLVVLSCASVFAYNIRLVGELVNPARGLDHSNNVDVNGNQYVYEGGATLEDQVADENLSITLASVVSDDSLTYIRFNVSTVNGESLSINEEFKKSVLSVQKFKNMIVKLNDTVISKDNYFMFRVDSGQDESKAVLELTILKVASVSGKTISITGTDYVDTYHLYNEEQKVIDRQERTLYNGTWNFSCTIPSEIINAACEYNGEWEISYEDKPAIISYVKITDLQVFLEGTIPDYVPAMPKSSQSTYLIYEDGTKIEAGNKVEGMTDKNGSFDSHWMLKNLVDGQRVVAIEYAGNLINLK